MTNQIWESIIFSKTTFLHSQDIQKKKGKKKKANNKIGKQINKEERKGAEYQEEVDERRLKNMTKTIKNI